MKLSTLLLVVLSIVGSIAYGDDTTKIKTLLITGQNNHDWAWTSESLKGILDASGRFDVTLTDKPAAALADAAATAKYRLFVLDYNGERWGEAAEKSFLAAVQGGAGVAVVHAANNAFTGWTEYERLVGDLWRDGTGHGEFHAFDVRIVDYSHPITRGLGEIRQHPDELYHNLVRAPGADHKAIAVAMSAAGKKGSGKDEPTILVGSYGKGRVFHTPLGHVWPNSPAQRVSHTDPRFRRLIARGCEWAATGDVKDAWIDLFNGKDMTGWTFKLSDANVAMADVWSVKDGAIRCLGKPAGYIRTERKFENFILEVDWRWEPKGDGGRNSGVLFRMTGDDKVWPKSLEAQLMSGEAGDFWQIDDFQATTAADRKNGGNTKKTHANEKPIGEWNHYRITVDRGTCVLEVNGQILNEASACAEVAGHICLQSEGAEIWFRNVRLLPLE